VSLDLSKKFEEKVAELLTKRKMMPSKKVGLKAFCDYFLAFAWLAHCREGDGFEMLEILFDDANLVSGEQFNKNFVLKFEKLYPAKLKTNKAWQRLLPHLVKFKGKGVGVGELYLAIVIQNWSFERTKGKGDGKVAGGIRELKKNGASLKPLSKSLRVQDELTRVIFEGHRPGPITKFNKFQEWIDTKTNAEEIYVNYFSQLYPGRNINKMCKDLVKAKTGREFYDTIGREVLRWYKSVDNWDSLVVIDEKNMVIANIADPSDEGLKIFYNIKFDWKTERGGDTQALSDGYVNITI
jgi:hypothetical protein